MIIQKFEDDRKLPDPNFDLPGYWHKVRTDHEQKQAEKLAKAGFKPDGYMLRKK